MNKMPRILFIDDRFGALEKNRTNRTRKEFCYKLKLQDVTGDILNPEKINEPIAEVYFLSGQVVKGDMVENSMESIQDFLTSKIGDYRQWAMIFLDLHFKTGRIDDEIGRTEDRDFNNYFGIQILKELNGHPSWSQIPVAIMSSMKREDVEGKISHWGAFDFLPRNESTAEQLHEMIDRLGLLEDDIIIGKSIALRKALRAARQQAKMGNQNILVIGETGTGKDMLAEYVHQYSHRPGEVVKFLANGFPETLIDDALFGHQKGAFEGARDDQPGVAERANNGTLYLDEFGDIPPNVQTKLLRLLDPKTREIQRLGSNKVTKLDLQIMLATNKFEILDGKDFRADLLARANSPIIMPNLNERKEDIPLLVEFFVRKYETAFNTPMREISELAVKKLTEHHWPDNVRDLEKVIKQAIFLYQGLRILVPNHIEFPAHSRAKSTLIELPKERQVGVRSVVLPSLDEIVRLLKEFDVEGESPTVMSGKLDSIVQAYGVFMAKLVKQALILTRSPIDQSIILTAAMKLLTGKKLTTTSAAGLLKKLLKADSDVQNPILEDQVLSEALRIANGLRPSNPSKRN